MNSYKLRLLLATTLENIVKKAALVFAGAHIIPIVDTFRFISNTHTLSRHMDRGTNGQKTKFESDSVCWSCARSVTRISKTSAVTL